MGSLHNFRTGLIAFCAMAALLCASCATTPVGEAEKATPEKRSQIMTELGSYALFRGDYASAIIDLKKAIDLDSGNVAAMVNLGLAYWQLDKRDLAISYFKRALEIDPENGDAHINLGTAAVNSDDLKTARHHYQKAIDNVQYKTRHRAITNLAEVAIRENKIDEARQLLYRSLQANPDYCLSHFLLGSIYARENNHTAAADEFKKSVRNTCAKNIEARYQLAISYMRLKQYTKARSEFVSLIEQHPQTKQAQSAGEHLKNLP